MILTPEIIEKAARAIIDRPPATIAGDYMLGRAKEDARAAISSVLPDIVEACAKVAQEYQDEDDGWSCGKIGDAIRALTEKEG